MKFQWKISGKKFTLDSRSGSDPSSGWCFEMRPGGWIVASRKRSDGSVERLRLSIHHARGKVSFQHAAIGNFFGEWTKLSAASGSAVNAVSAADFTAQFPGKVRKILVAEGAAVVENQKLVLVEAMKMEFAIQAPCAGKVAKIRVNEGQQLSPGDLLLDFEARSNGTP